MVLMTWKCFRQSSENNNKIGTNWACCYWSFPSFFSITWTIKKHNPDKRKKSDVNNFIFGFDNCLSSIICRTIIILRKHYDVIVIWKVCNISADIRSATNSYLIQQYLIALGNNLISPQKLPKINIPIEKKNRAANINLKTGWSLWKKFDKQLASSGPVPVKEKNDLTTNALGKCLNRFYL